MRRLIDCHWNVNIFPTTRLYLDGPFKLYHPLNWSTASISLFISLSSSEIKKHKQAARVESWQAPNLNEAFQMWLNGIYHDWTASVAAIAKKSRPLNCWWQFLPLLQFLVDQFPIDSKHFQTCFRLWDFDFWKLKLNEIEVEAKFENFFRPTQPIFILPSNTVRWANVLTSSAKSVHLTMPLRFIKRSFFTLSKIFRAICRLATFGL